MKPLRKLNDQGMDEFEDWLSGGASGAAPLHLLSGQTTSVPVLGVNVPKLHVASRYELGIFLGELLASIDPVQLSVDRHLWTSLTLLWFDSICPVLSNGSRKLDKMYRYVLSTDYRHYYRHLVRTPWQLVRDHGANARLLLMPSSDRPAPLRIHGEVLEQLGSRQSLLRSTSLIAAANRLFGDPKTGRPRAGVASKNKPGTVRRLGDVLRQFDLTFDVGDMEDEQVLALLPGEFDRWKPSKTTGKPASTLATSGAVAGAQAAM